jgi:hypothetical protein
MNHRQPSAVDQFCQSAKGKGPDTPDPAVSHAALKQTDERRPKLSIAVTYVALTSYRISSVTSNGMKKLCKLFLQGPEHESNMNPKTCRRLCLANSLYPNSLISSFLRPTESRWQSPTIRINQAPKDFSGSSPRNDRIYRSLISTI